MSNPGKESKTFKIKLDKNWLCNTEIIDPREFRISENGYVKEYLTIDEVIERYGDSITREELEELKRSKQYGVKVTKSREE